ncbi:MAG TPA: hypothetical protein VGP06_02120 [Janthinobacterium sp.]|nr:hypothetical protein [Janthinobacterium sp.]
MEAIAAFFSLVFIVWWTMYSGRPEFKKPSAAPEIPAPGSAAPLESSARQAE